MSKTQQTFDYNELSLVREDKIRREVFSLENKRSSLVRSLRECTSKSEAKPIRDEILLIESNVCHLQRELEIRGKRKKAHEEFVNKIRNNRARSR